ncbi:ATP-dependent DNA/RNA helicase DHX36 isoform X2 [Anabrus simplex]|uniref:ATP-dependent DNA/RNA helicase DHX36 isoform X2 n=1 Tax=Anabrus simplex TaxID=316456 RepID=UPI0035A2A09A
MAEHMSVEQCLSSITNSYTEVKQRITDGSSSHYMGGRERRGRGRGRSPMPRGLRGKEIGLYYRDRARARNRKAEERRPELEIYLDPQKEAEIRKLLTSLRSHDHPGTSGVMRNNTGEELVEQKVKVKCEIDEDSSNEGDDVQVKMEMDTPPPIKTEDVSKEEVVVNPVEKYHYIGDSRFKHSFLASITGSMQEKLEQAVTFRSGLLRDPSLDQSLKEELLEKQTSDRHYARMMEFRRKLPSYQMRHKIIDLISENQVCVISGETGCGKTTQLAQFILDDCIMRGQGSLCRVVCTQPRRISAISVAERVSDERAEPLGTSTGYQIRVEKVMPRKKGSILFCTTGVLLQWMRLDPALVEVSHLILDEIHERDTVSDFLITVLKDVIPKRPDLKLVLMSATLNAEQFSKYYNNCPCINIPGFTYPVEEFYLEDVLQMTNFQFKPSQMPVMGWKKHLKANKSKMRKMEEFKDFIEPYIRDLQSKGKYSPAVLEALKNPESEELNLELMLALINHICQTKEDGAILVFLPGWDKISNLNKLMTESGQFPAHRFIIIPLHSMMPTVMQKSVFERPNPGVRKIIIATNIAETSITIDDVVYVIDGGRIKLKNFDSEANISTLQAEWVSLANARQRRGRAGRVQPGICYHMYTRAREMMFADYMLPEMLRTRLDEVILQIKILQLGKVTRFLERVMDPPDPRAIDVSLKLLRGMNALDDDENLTPLGYHLAQLPLDPQTGKMILMASMFSCVDPVFSVAASLSFKDAFLVPLGMETKVNLKKDELSGGMKSDHLLLAEAFRRWEEASEMGRGHNFCWEYFLSQSTLCLLRDMKAQFAEHLYKMNFLEAPDTKTYSANHNSHNLSLVKAMICAGLYPNVAIIKKVKKVRNTDMFKKKIMTPEDGGVSLHPRSVNEREKMFESPFLVYYLKLKSSAIYLHDTTMVHPLPLLFFGGGIKYNAEDKVISVNDVLRFTCQESTAFIILELKKCLDNLLEYKISHPGVTDWRNDSEEGTILKAIIELITQEDIMELEDDDFSD